MKNILLAVAVVLILSFLPGCGDEFEDPERNYIINLKVLVRAIEGTFNELDKSIDNISSMPKAECKSEFGAFERDFKRLTGVSSRIVSKAEESKTIRTHIDGALRYSLAASTRARAACDGLASIGFGSSRPLDEAGENIEKARAELESVVTTVEKLKL
ncbi:MAG: hypothetical protein IH874_00260 [Candidatus Dadabacteria bacterium]|nr:hypothetical protein [Candidatus Dadabacteria bacterium]